MRLEVDVLMKSLVVELCAGTACHLMGAGELIEAVQGLSVDMQRLVSVQLTHCLGACGQGPNARVGGVVYSNLNGEKLQRLLVKLLEGRELQ